MDLTAAVADILLGASLQQVAAAYREHLLREFAFRPEETTPETFRSEVTAFMRTLARHLGDRHAGDPRIAHALRAWIMVSDHYEAWDALLSGFDVEDREALVRRGRVLFPGTLTAHWSER